MRAVTADRVRDLPEINQWQRAHGKSPYHIDELPKHGFIVHGIACGWIYLTDSNICFPDGFVSNPARTSEERHEAFVIIGTLMHGAAMALGCRRAVVFTENDGIVKRALSHGFTEHGMMRQLQREL